MYLPVAIFSSNSFGLWIGRRVVLSWEVGLFRTCMRLLDQSRDHSGQWRAVVLLGTATCLFSRWIVACHAKPLLLLPPHA
jgi:hypothetical protein